jgi:hypothetical protein
VLTPLGRLIDGKPSSDQGAWNDASPVVSGLGGWFEAVGSRKASTSASMALVSAVRRRRRRWACKYAQTGTTCPSIAEALMRGLYADRSRAIQVA